MGFPPPADRRRVQCDSLRPSCSQCRRSGLNCGGYERQRIFVNSTKRQSYTGEPYVMTRTVPAPAGAGRQDSGRREPGRRDADAAVSPPYRAPRSGELFWETYCPLEPTAASLCQRHDPTAVAAARKQYGHQDTLRLSVLASSAAALRDMQPPEETVYTADLAGLRRDDFMRFVDTPGSLLAPCHPLNIHMIAICSLSRRNSHTRCLPNLWMQAASTTSGATGLGRPVPR